MGYHRNITRDVWFNVMSTTYKNGQKIYWIIEFSECDYCGKRKLETNHYKYNKFPHKGIEKLKHYWEKEGIILKKPSNNKNINNKNNASYSKRYSDQVEKLINLALDTHYEEEAISIIKKARKVYKNDKNSN